MVPDEPKNVVVPTKSKPIVLEELKEAWNQFAAQRKNQVAEFHLLSQPFEIIGNEVVLHLSNPVEEPLLESIKSDLTTHLRNKLENAMLSITSSLKELDARKIIYTDKEKFDHLAEKHPLLHELKQRLGLDTDF